MLTRVEFAALLGIKRESFNTMLCSGDIVPPDEGTRKNARWHPETVEAWIASRPGRHGAPVTDPLVRFMRKVRKDASGCWLWQGYIAENGYGTFRTSRNLQGPAHRRGYELMVGPIPAGLHIDHLCRVRACVNPDHLEAVTPRENILRAPKTWGGKNAPKTHCPRNHEYTPENTRRDPKGSRLCRECGRIKWRAWYQKQKAQAAQASEPALPPSQPMR